MRDSDITADDICLAQQEHAVFETGRAQRRPDSRLEALESAALDTLPPQNGLEFEKLLVEKHLPLCPSNTHSVSALIVDAEKISTARRRGPGQVRRCDSRDTDQERYFLPRERNTIGLIY